VVKNAVNIPNAPGFLFRNPLLLQVGQALFQLPDPGPPRRVLRLVALRRGEDRVGQAGPTASRSSASRVRDRFSCCSIRAISADKTSRGDAAIIVLTIMTV
jgi:hypothetical protein